ncbi:hypothetical protein Q8G38_16965 [Halomonas venusta]|uniref:hypothetical protein n=1 Tax=Vreelandella venusta TaxID=44935 RepID=UPI00295EB4EB|nr:hypothetical protein [Halomonas venusta]MDW0361008.1 hypothetical protein [Halomonas venusta]
MSEWRLTGKAGWDEETGVAVYYVTKDSTSLNVNDHIELGKLLAEAQDQEPSREN